MCDGIANDGMFPSGPVEPEGLRGGASMLGDFYREPDDAVRGVSMAHAQAGGLPEAFNGVEGDFYRERGDPLKGLSAGGASGAHGTSGLMGGVGSGFASDPLAGHPPGGVCADFPDKALGLHKSGQQHHHEGGIAPSILTSGLDEFKEGDHPPAKPTDKFFKLEITTVTISSERPFTIGKSVLSFLASKVTSSVSKVNTRKFAIKADVFVGSVMCTLKVRVYGTETHTYAVEFQRRSGDCLTFNSTYQQAAAYLQKAFGCAQCLSQAVRVEQPPRSTPLKRTLEKEEVSPLLEMAGMTAQPSLQAESAAALSDLAQDTGAAQALCSPAAFHQIEKLLQAETLDVAYPTSRLLLLIAHCPEAATCFASGGLLPLLLERLRSKATKSLVRQKLAQVLRAAVSRCGGAMSHEGFQQVELALSEAMKDEFVQSDAAVRMNLAEASCDLGQVKARRVGGHA